MPRPQSKSELQTLSQKNYEQLLLFVANLPDEKREKEFPEGTMNRNIRDIIGHLHHWHLLFFNWYEIGMEGKKPAIPKEGYTFADTPRLNREIWQECQHFSLKEITTLFEQSHQKIMQIIEKHSNEELFTKKKYAWTGSTSLGAYLVSATSSHYDWALKLIRKNTK